MRSNVPTCLLALFLASWGILAGCGPRRGGMPDAGPPLDGGPPPFCSLETLSGLTMRCDDEAAEMRIHVGELRARSIVLTTPDGGRWEADCTRIMERFDPTDGECGITLHWQCSTVEGASVDFEITGGYVSAEWFLSDNAEIRVTEGAETTTLDPRGCALEP